MTTPLHKEFEEYEYARKGLEKARSSLATAASRLYVKGRLVYVNSLGYGVVISELSELLLQFDVHTKTYDKPPRIDKEQVHSVRLENMRPVPWEEAIGQPGLMNWIMEHPLNDLIHKASKQHERDQQAATGNVRKPWWAW